MKRNELDSKFDKLKNYSKELEIKTLNKSIYNLNISKETLKNASQNILQYIHVKLHNSYFFKKPFAKKEDIKKFHDKISKYIPNHKYIDELDDI